MSKLENPNEFQYTQVPTIEITRVHKDSEKNVIPETYGYGVRHIQLLLFFLCAVTAFFARGHLGVTLVAMTSQRNDTSIVNIKGNNLSLTSKPFQGKEFSIASDDYIKFELNQTIEVIESNSSDITSYHTNEAKTTFKWSKSIQEMVLTSFFVGYCLMMLPSSLVCQRWGGMVPLQVSMLINGVVSILTPWMAYWGGWQAVCLCRLLQGLSQAGTYPGLQTLISQWAPETEKSTLSSFVYTGTTLGSMLSFQLSGLISESLGWPATFWSVGALCFVMLTLITLFGASSPRVHKSISEEERSYIIKHTHTSVKKSRRVPWKALATSRPLLANYAAAVGTGINYIFFFTQLPTYIHYIYGVNIKNSGLLTSLPYIAGLFASGAFALASEYLTNKNILSKKNARRCSNLIAQAGMASALLGASYASNSTIAVVCFVIFMMSYMGIHTGWMINQIDLTPNYSGTLIAISNVLTNLVVMVMPFIISNVIIDVRNVYQWRIMLFIEASLALTGIIFAVFLSVDVQPWNETSDPVTGWGCRHQQSLILFLTLTIAHSMRACMGVAVIAMTHHDFTTPVVSNLSNARNFTRNLNTTEANENMETNIDADDFHVKGFFNALMLTPPYPTFKWSKKVQDMVISSFFWGYMALQLPARQLAHRFGARYILAGAMLINCLLCVLLPLASFYGGWIYTVIFRILQGVAQVYILPGMHTLFGKWAPLEKRG